ncbi:PP2C family serine/threonine-protein phosphatase [Dyadobacter sp. 3J3]|uniref:PP2C family serine/threonine-protein phosphatase n=1 Tax=Dyadobacter sp. 3J3 TaxID=2606600 RepID=UPI00135BD436|nr:PP2C family serine/threonine-protein phosphatase [Dyadobacter sp. 3J3]
MSEIKQYIQTLLAQKNISVAKNRESIFEEFTKEEANIFAVNQIKDNQKMMLDKWVLKNRVSDIIDQQLIIPNATVGKPYEVYIDYSKAGMDDLAYTSFDDLGQFGLEYNEQLGTIKGIPTKSGEFKISMKFRVNGENEDSELNNKKVSLIINADPKSLWKNIPSDLDKDEIWKNVNYWKPDIDYDFKPLGDKHIVVASKRGRSHANVGSFRDDDFSFKHLEETGWSIVCVADGAGSASLSRLGSKLACEFVISYFEENFNSDIVTELDSLIKNRDQSQDDVKQKNLDLFIYNNLGKAAFFVHKGLQDYANKLERPLKDLHSTLIFALFKKYDFGYAILSFGVGDCPIGLVNKDLTEIQLMNWLDVGEFGGGTRFITMPEIFSSNKFPTRFGFKVVEDFSYLMLMTDGIYDPKFVVEANLEKIECWSAFLEDLHGDNESNIKVELIAKNENLPIQLSEWMDFWSSGNHDDRTLAIVF